MPMDGPRMPLRMLHLIQVNLASEGISVETVEGSLCLFRPVYDKPSATTLGMSSAIAGLARGDSFAKFYCVESRGVGDEIAKFTYRLVDTKGVTVHEWHKDLSHGLHTHPVIDGSKGQAHIPFDGTDADMAMDIIEAVRAHLLASNPSLERP
jgi:hypothetical protein